jgi:hypothetical protein
MANRGRNRAGVPAAQGTESGAFGGADPGYWAYFQHLEQQVKNLAHQVETEALANAQLVERLNLQDQHIASLSADIAALRQQLAGSPAEGSPAEASAEPVAESTAQQ